MQSPAADFCIHLTLMFFLKKNTKSCEGLVFIHSCPLQQRRTLTIGECITVKLWSLVWLICIQLLYWLQINYIFSFCRIWTIKNWKEAVPTMMLHPTVSVLGFQPTIWHCRLLYPGFDPQWRKKVFFCQEIGTGRKWTIRANKQLYLHETIRTFEGFVCDL